MSRPWEDNAGSRPWETGFLYDRTVSFKRPNNVSGAGYVGYSGVSQSNETLLVSGIAANIQFSKSTRITGAMPGDSPALAWTITLPASANLTQTVGSTGTGGLLLALLGDGGSGSTTITVQIQNRDLIYDDLGRRFQVSGFEPTPLGYAIAAVQLEA